jgi:hypothetical protein
VGSRGRPWTSTRPPRRPTSTSSATSPSGRMGRST